MPVFILMMHVKPTDENPGVNEIAGAYVNCFVESDTFDTAEKMAIQFIRNHHWAPIDLEEGYEVTEADYDGDPNGLEIYKQVLIEKEKYTFHTYTIE